MSSIQQVMDGLATTITNATTIRCFSYIPEDANPPVLILDIEEIDRGAFSCGQFNLSIQGILLLSRASERSAEKSKNTFASWDSTSSIWKAVDATPGVGLSDTALAVISYESLGFIDLGAYTYLAGKFRIIGQTQGA